MIFGHGSHFSRALELLFSPSFVISQGGRNILFPHFGRHRRVVDLLDLAILGGCRER